MKNPTHMATEGLRERGRWQQLWHFFTIEQRCEFCPVDDTNDKRGLGLDSNDVMCDDGDGKRMEKDEPEQRERRKNCVGHTCNFTRSEILIKNIYHLGGFSCPYLKAYIWCLFEL